jgi:ribosomal protein S27AE
MTFSATLDFERFFGLPRACPDCGSAAVGIVHGHSESRFQCRDCGTRWQWMSAGVRANGPTDAGWGYADTAQPVS